MELAICGSLMAPTGNGRFLFFEQSNIIPATGGDGVRLSIKS